MPDTNIISRTSQNHIGARRKKFIALPPCRIDVIRYTILAQIEDGAMAVFGGNAAIALVFI